MYVYYTRVTSKENLTSIGSIRVFHLNFMRSIYIDRVKKVFPKKKFITLLLELDFFDN